MTTITIEQAYEKGWIAAAKWASRDDLIADIGSAAYTNDRDSALAAPATAPEHPTQCGCCQPFCRSCNPKRNTHHNLPKNKDDLP